MFYFVKTPWLLRKLYTSCTWQIRAAGKTIFLTFDDGPHPEATPYVLDELKKYNAKATFFCIGKNVTEHPAIFNRLIDEGHVVGNHTFNHLNGWKTSDTKYLVDISEAQKIIPSLLFRPPYGRIKMSQLRKLGHSEMKIIMWTVLSGDFDPGITAEKCAANVIENSCSGSIVVFHDSAKAMEKLRYSLPRVLEYFHQKGYTFRSIDV